MNLISVYKLGNPLNRDFLAQALLNKPLVELRADEVANKGWVDPFFSDESTVIQGLPKDYIVFAMAEQKKRISQNAIDQELKRQLLLNPKFNNEDDTKKIKIDIESKAIIQALPEIKKYLIMANDKYLVIGASVAKAEQIISALRVLHDGTLPVAPFIFPLNAIAENAFFGHNASLLIPTQEYCKLQLNDGGTPIPMQIIKYSESIPEGQRNFLEVSFGFNLTDAGGLTFKLSNSNCIKAIKIKTPPDKKDFSSKEAWYREYIRSLVLELDELWPQLEA